MATKPRRSRTAWPGPTSKAGLEPGHTHNLPRGFRIIVKAQTAAIVALLLAVAVLSWFVWDQQAYIEGKGEERDRETVELNERINGAICALLDRLPEGGVLERPRREYGCGPGIPLDDLPPDEADRIREQRGQPAVAAPDPLDRFGPFEPPASPPVGTGGALPPSPAPATEPPAEPTPTPEPAPDPVVDLSPVTEAADDLLCPLICLEEP